MSKPPPSIIGRKPEVCNRGLNGDNCFEDCLSRVSVAPLKIYLASICERQNTSLYLDRRLQADSNESFIAISHVRGDPLTIRPIRVNGVGLVDLGPGKSDILTILRRPVICGDNWF